METATAPRLRVVVVHYGDAERTVRCVASLLGADLGAVQQEVVVVDNGGDAGLDEQLPASPSVRVVRSDRNLGFGGGANLGIGDLAGIDLVALVNNDAVVAPGWLGPLVAAAGGARVGAVNPKVLLAGRRMSLLLDGSWRGVLRELRVGGVDVLAEALVTGGISDERPGAGREVVSEGRVAVPGEEGDEIVLVYEDGPRPWPEPWRSEVLLNSAGATVGPHGIGADRGWLEPDVGQYDEPAALESWTGSAVLLRADYLEDVGRFDERFFLYYEDRDLAWRGARRGWQYRYEPASVVVHEVGATAGRSALHARLDHRNRLLAVLRNAPPRDVVSTLLADLRATAAYAARDVVRPLLRGRRPRARVVRSRLRALGGALRLAWGTLRRRRGDR